ncbi:MAG TPA: GntR family transcriptional regulator [Candidatus Dormibacteraeota bacterium]|nr:GntR family transcriptional regulator [Candidatus Dormibacteraeota bacterium]
MPTVRLEGPQPGYEILFSEIYEKIRSGEWSPDARLPSERELCARYGVSRTMVRQALLKAEQHGLLVRTPGRGTFVAKPHIRQELGSMQSFSSTLEQHALKPGRRILSCAWRAASDHVAHCLEVAPGSAVLTVESLGLADGRPMAFYRSSLGPVVAELVEAALKADQNAGAETTYELAARGLHEQRLVAEQTFEVARVDATAAMLLQARLGFPAFRVETVFRAASGAPIEHRVALYPGDRYSFHIVRELQISDA